MAELPQKKFRGWKYEQQLVDQSTSSGSKEHAARSDHSALASLLLLLWASGNISATAMHKVALCAMLDGANHVELANLAKCGAWGQQPGNVARDVNATFLHSVLVSPSMSAEVPCIDPKTSKATVQDCHFFLPHLMFWSLMKNYTLEAQIVFALDAIDGFWEGVVSVGCPKLVGHPLWSITNFATLRIPLFIHGDGVEFVNGDSLMVYSWGSLLSAGSSQDTSLLAAVWPKNCTIDVKGQIEEGTWWKVLVWLQWSFDALFEGRHPDKDPWGNVFLANSLFQDLAGTSLCDSGHRGVLWSLEGDQDYFANTLKLNHWNNPNPCWACDTVTTDPQKTWKNLMPNQTGWISKNAAQAKATLTSRHPLLRIRGVTTLMISPDALHILFCKGILSRLLGSVLHLWCWPIKGGRQETKPADTLAAIFCAVQCIYKELNTPTRLTNLRLGMFSNPDKPHASDAFLNIKGSECKHLLKPLAIISSRKNNVSELDKRIASCLLAMDRLVDIMDESEIFLEEKQHQEMVVALAHFNGHYSWLNSWAASEERQLFHITIKFHMNCHLVMTAKCLNPKFFWCFRGEDYVGRISALAASVSMGVGVIALSTKIVSKYRHWRHLRLTRGDFHD